MKKRVTTEIIYDDNGRVLKTIVTEEYDEEPLQNPYGYPYCGQRDKAASESSPLGVNITYTNGSATKGVTTCR